MGLARRSTTLVKTFVNEHYIKQMTKEGVVVIHGKNVEYDPTSFYIFSIENKIRYPLIWLVEWKYFEWALILIILLNSLALALYDFQDLNNLTAKNQLLNKLSIAFDVIFITECFIKVLAMGFFMHKASYLRNGWNLLDLIVVISAILELVPALQRSSLSAVRALRTIRPLRTINAIPSMKKLVKTLIISLPLLGNVVALLAFIILLFGILGLNVFCGNLYYRCRTTQFPVNDHLWPILDDYNELCYRSGDYSTCPENTYCGHPSDYGIPLEYENISSTQFMDYGIVHFDNIGYSLLTIFQVITVQGWSQIMYNYMDSTNVYFSSIFYSVLVIFGSFFVLNLILAVIIEAYKKQEISENKKEIEKLENQVKQKEARFLAIKMMFRMMRVSQKKREFALSANQIYKWTFYDVVFEIIRITKFRDLMSPQKLIQSQKTMVQSIKNAISQKLINQLDKSLIKLDEIKEEEGEIFEEESPNTRKRIFSRIPQEQEESSSQQFDLQSERGLMQTNQKQDISINTANFALGKTNTNIKDNNKSNQDNQHVDAFDEQLFQNDPAKNKGNNQQLENDKSLFQGLQKSLTLKSFNLKQTKILPSLLGVKTKIKPLKSLKNICFQVTCSYSFKILITILIIANTIILACDQYPISKSQQTFQNVTNYIFFAVFALEMALKLIALGFKGYTKEIFNIFDAIIVTLNFIDIILNIIQKSKKVDSLSTLKAFRILRLFKLFEQQEKLQELLSTIVYTLKDLRNFSILLLICIFSYTMLGLQLFAYKVRFNEDDEYDMITGVSPRINFDGFTNAFLAVFNVLQGERWHTIMYNVARSCGHGAIFYFITLIIIGQIILLKLFLAVLLENFEENKALIENTQELNPAKNLIDWKLMLERIFQKCIFMKRKTKYHQEEDTINETVNKPQNIIKQDRSLLIFTAQNKFRRIMLAITNSNKYQGLILLLIIISSITLAIENPLEDGSTTKSRILYSINVIVTSIFTTEVVIKTIAYGFIFNGKKSYLRELGNIIDAIIIIFSLISIIGNNDQLKIFKILRLIRVMRPIRLISRNEGLQLALKTLVKAIPQLLTVFAFIMVFYLLFGTFCVSLLKGKYYSCNITGLSTELPEIITKFDCINNGGLWQNSHDNFDNIINAMILIFTMGQVNWVNHMWNAVDATDIGLEPVLNYNKYWSIFFIVFMIIFTFFLMNLFVGVIVITFQQEKKRLGKNFLLTPTQKEWLNIKMTLFNTKPVLKKQLNSNNMIRQFCFQVVSNNIFEGLIFICILINTIVLMLKWYEMSSLVDNIVQIINYIFALVFTIEAILKISAFGFKYFKDNWNKFDIFIVLATIVGIILDISLGSVFGSKTTLIRAFRVARIFRLIQKAKFLRIIIDTLIVIMPSIANVGGLLLLLIYIYTVLGMQLFAGIKQQEVLNDQANFQTFGTAFLTLLRFLGGEEWDQMMYDILKGPSPNNQCDIIFNQQAYNENKTINGCGSNISTLYFCSYNLLVSTIFINLFVAIILESFDVINTKENQFLCEENTDHLRDCWADFDPEGTHFILVNDLIPFLTKLKEPLGFSKIEISYPQIQWEFMRHIKLPTYNQVKHYYYYDVVQALSQHAFIKGENLKKMRSILIDKKTDLKKLTPEVFSDLQQELHLDVESFKQHNIHALNKAVNKEKQIYSNINAQKDQMNSQYLWAGSRILHFFRHSTSGLKKQRQNEEKKQNLIESLNQSEIISSLPDTQQLNLVPTTKKFKTKIFNNKKTVEKRIQKAFKQKIEIQPLLQQRKTLEKSMKSILEDGDQLSLQENIDVDQNYDYNLELLTNDDAKKDPQLETPIVELQETVQKNSLAQVLVFRQEEIDLIQLKRRVTVGHQPRQRSKQRQLVQQQDNLSQNESSQEAQQQVQLIASPQQQSEQNPFNSMR